MPTHPQAQTPREPRCFLAELSSEDYSIRAVIGGVTVVVTNVPDAGPGSPEGRPHARTVILPRPSQQNDGGLPKLEKAAVATKVRRPAVESPAVQLAPAQPTRMPSASRAAPEPAKVPVGASDDTKAVTATPGSPASVDGTATAGPRRAASAATHPSKRRTPGATKAVAAPPPIAWTSISSRDGAHTQWRRQTASCWSMPRPRTASRGSSSSSPRRYTRRDRARRWRACRPGIKQFSAMVDLGRAAVAFLVLASLGGYMYWAQHGHPTFPGLH